MTSAQRSSIQHDEAKLWDTEYGELKVIPSSTSQSPSRALLLFSELLDFTRFRKVLDAGCGIGRNSIYLAKKGCNVHAVDISITALGVLKSAAAKEGVSAKITVHNIALRDVFPFAQDEFDLVLDSYVFCHFTDERFKKNYREELNRVTKPGGIVLSTLFSVEDEYYRAALQNGFGAGNVVTDPNNGITKQLYTESEIKELFSSSFEIPYFVKFEFQDVVLGKLYKRSILVLALRKPE